MSPTSDIHKALGGDFDEMRRLVNEKTAEAIVTYLNHASGIKPITKRVNGVEYPDPYRAMQLSEIVFEHLDSFRGGLKTSHPDNGFRSAYERFKDFPGVKEAHEAHRQKIAIERGHEQPLGEKELGDALVAYFQHVGGIKRVSKVVDGLVVDDQEGFGQLAKICQPLISAKDNGLSKVEPYNGLKSPEERFKNHPGMKEAAKAYRDFFKVSIFGDRKPNTVGPRFPGPETKLGETLMAYFNAVTGKAPITKIVDGRVLPDPEGFRHIAETCQTFIDWKNGGLRTDDPGNGMKAPSQRFNWIDGLKDAAKAHQKFIRERSRKIQTAGPEMA